MLKQNVLDHFGGTVAVAKKIGVSPAAVSSWGSIVPKGRAYELEKLTDGALKVDPKLYEVSPDTNSTAA